MMKYKISIVITENGKMDVFAIRQGKWSYRSGETWSKFLAWLGEVEPNINLDVKHVESEDE